MNSTISRISFFTVLLLLSCTHNSSRVEEVETPLKHIVLLDLKESCTAKEEAGIVAQLNSLSRIEGVYNLEVSRRFETEDPRALEDYDLMLYMEFEDLISLKAYSSNPEHLSIREQVSPYLDRIPAIVDSWN